MRYSVIDGGMLPACTATDRRWIAAAPPLSTTRTEMRWVPGLTNTRDALVPLASSKAPSLSRSQAYDTTGPSESCAKALNDTGVATRGFDGYAYSDTNGLRFPVAGEIVTTAWPTVVAPAPLDACTRIS